MPTRAHRRARDLALDLRRLIREADSEAYEGGLTPAQWSALRYFAEARTEDRTVVGFMRHHRTTQGTASSTILTLERKGLVEKCKLAKDRRVARIELTQAGCDLLAGDPLNRLAEAFASLPDELFEALASATAHAARAMRLDGGDGAQGDADAESADLASPSALAAD